MPTTAVLAVWSFDSEGLALIKGLILVNTSTTTVSLCVAVSARQQAGSRSRCGLVPLSASQQDHLNKSERKFNHAQFSSTELRGFANPLAAGGTITEVGKFDPAGWSPGRQVRPGGTAFSKAAQSAMTIESNMSKRKKLNRFNRSNLIPAKLGKADQYHLDQFQRKLNLIQDRTLSVAQGFQNGTYLVGPPGVSKTFTVEQTLKNVNASFVMLNSKITAPGLWHHLKEHPDHVTVIDDVPSVVSEKAAQQLLLAALGGPAGEPRKIKYTTAEVDGRKDFEFRGSIIAISNVPLRRDPMADAVASRVPIMEHEPTDDEVAAFMRSLAIKGHKNLTAAEAIEVAEFVIGESKASDYRLDLRHLIKGWGDRLFWKKNPDRTHWTDLVRTSMKKSVADVGVKPLSQEERLADERMISRELFKQFPKRGDKKSRDKVWTEKTGKSADTLYRHKRWLDGLAKG